MRWSRVSSPLRATASVIAASERNKKLRAAPSLACLRDLRLNDMVVAQGSPGAARDLVARQFDQGVEGAAGDAHRHPGKARGVKLQARETVEQSRLVARSAGVAGDAKARRHKQVADRILVAAGALETDDMPDIGHPRRGFWKQEGVYGRSAIGLQAWPAVTLDNRQMSAKPACLVAAAGKGKARGDPVAAVHDPRLARARTPGKDPVGSAKNLARGLGVEIGRGHRTAGGLVERPRRTGVGLGDGLDDPHKSGG